MPNVFFSKLLSSVSPRSDNYFVLFNKLTDCIVRGAKILATMSSVQDQNAFNELFVQMSKTESEADEITKTIFCPCTKLLLPPSTAGTSKI